MSPESWLWPFSRLHTDANHINPCLRTDVAVRTRMTARGVRGLGAGLRAFGTDFETQFLQAIFLVAHVNVLLLSSVFRRVDGVSVPFALWLTQLLDIAS